MATAKTPLQKVLDMAGQFVVTQNGCWEHEDWEALLTKVAATGIQMDDEGKRNLGNILEAAKYYLSVTPKAAPKKAAARPKKKA